MWAKLCYGPGHRQRPFSQTALINGEHLYLQSTPAAVYLALRAPRIDDPAIGGRRAVLPLTDELSQRFEQFALEPAMFIMVVRERRVFVGRTIAG